MRLTRCPNCPGTHRCVQPSGPESAEVMFIGERPGRTENANGIPFSGPSGREFNENYLWLAGLSREGVHVTNTVLCGADGNRKPSEKEIRGCADHHLPEEISRCSPSLIVLLGATACALVPDIDLDIEHGIPRIASLYDWEGVVVPMYHPAAGLHDTGKMIPLLEDFERLKLVINGEWEAPNDPHPNPEYRLITSARDLRTQVWDWSAPFTAVDTERHGDTAFSVQFSQHSGTGYMVLASKPQLVIHRLVGESRPSPGDPLWVLSNLFKDYDGEVILHNAGQDLDWLDRMGIHVTRFRDTMQEAYHLGNLPQGLKALAYRLLGIRMRTYEDVVVPHSREAMSDWLLTALDHVESTRQRVEHKQLKTKLKEIRKPCELERAIRRITRYTLDNPEYDPWKKIAEWQGDKKRDGMDQEDWSSTVGALGEPPILGIGNVPIEEAVQYGCCDADMTLRVALELDKRRKQAHKDWTVSEEDKDR